MNLCPTLYSSEAAQNHLVDPQPADDAVSSFFTVIPHTHIHTKGTICGSLLLSSYVFHIKLIYKRQKIMKSFSTQQLQGETDIEENT